MDGGSGGERGAGGDEGGEGGSGGERGEGGGEGGESGGAGGGGHATAEADAILTAESRRGSPPFDAASGVPTAVTRKPRTCEPPP